MPYRIFTSLFCVLLFLMLLMDFNIRDLVLLVPFSLQAAVIATITLPLVTGLISFYAFQNLKSLSATKIHKPPGSLSSFILAFIYSKKKYQTLFEQTIADMREEYNEALSESRTWKANWIHVRGIFSIFMTAIADFPVSIIGLVVKLWTAAK